MKQIPDFKFNINLPGLTGKQLIHEVNKTRSNPTYKLV